MALIPKVKFKWREPKAFVEDRDGRDRKAVIWWRQVVGVGVVAVLMMPVWYLAMLNPEKSPPRFEIAVVLALILGAFLVYAVPWMIRRCPSEVRLTDDALLWLRGNRPRAAKWKEVSAFSFTERGGFQVLRLELCKGGELELGLAASVPLAEVRRFLQGVGLAGKSSEQEVNRNA